MEKDDTGLASELKKDFVPRLIELSCTLSCTEYSIVSRNALTIAITTHLMISISITGSTTFWAVYTWGL